MKMYLPCETHRHGSNERGCVGERDREECIHTFHAMSSLKEYANVRVRYNSKVMY